MPVRDFPRRLVSQGLLRSVERVVPSRLFGGDLVDPSLLPANGLSRGQRRLKVDGLVPAPGPGWETHLILPLHVKIGTHEARVTGDEDQAFVTVTRGEE